MKGVVFLGNRELELRDFPDPTPGPGEVVLEIKASGLSQDRASSIYQKFVVPPGRHVVSARLRDSARTEGFDYARSTEVELRPRQNFVVDFRAETGGFSFH